VSYREGDMKRGRHKESEKERGERVGEREPIEIMVLELL